MSAREQDIAVSVKMSSITLYIKKGAFIMNFLEQI